MWGSRLLFGGYGTSDQSAPREAGLLAFDTAVIVDEAHLAGQLLVTARQVSRLAGVAERPVTSVPTLQVVETSATPATGCGPGPYKQLTSVAVNDRDLSEKLLADRLTRPKPLTLLASKHWPPARQPGKAAGLLADAVTIMLRPPAQAGVPVHTVGCFVNTVPMAVAVTDALRRRSLDGRALRVVMVCGQIRPADLVRLARRYPGILKPEGNSKVDVIVATQSLEVGADIDLAGIVTELAAGSALAQRAGRANRRGLREQGVPVTVVVPEEPITERTRSGPYTHQELADALAWVTERATQPEGLAPWALREHQPPPARSRRKLHQRPELADAWHWARTSDDLAADPELSLWLAESLEVETSVGIAVRDALPEVPAEAVEFVRDLPPAAREIFPVPYRTAQSALTSLLEPGRTLIRVRGEDISPLRQRARADGIPSADLRPGDVVVIDSTSEIFTPGTAGMDGGFSPPVPAPASTEDPDGIDPVLLATAGDVLHYVADPGPGEVVLRLEAPPDSGTWKAGIAGLDARAVRQVLDEFADGFDESTERDRRYVLAGLLRASPQLQDTGEPQGMLEAAIGLLRSRVKDSDVILRRDDEQRPVRVLVIDRRRASADEDLRQTFSTRDERDGPVLLACHQAEVSARAGLLADRLGLGADLAGALRLAGLHHDDGKADPRFQSRLGAQDCGIVLAKSDPRSTVRQVREREARAGLPGRWRHEQRSVADSWDAVHADPGIDPLLVARLIGTSHGYGRSGFPHTGGQLPGDEYPEQLRQLAVGLFDHGGWDDLIEATQVRYGVWGCAYLEAVLRAADGQVSGEGK